jgi:hypothetical protein
MLKIFIFFFYLLRIFLLVKNTPKISRKISYNRNPINYNTSTYDDNKEADTAHSIHRTDKIKWFDISNNNNNINNNNNKLESSSFSYAVTTTTTTTTTINNNTSAYDDNNQANIAQHSIHCTDKILEWSKSMPNNNNNSKN